MSTKNNSFEFTQTDTKPNGLLNVLTILSIIGSIMGFLSSIVGFIGAKKNYDDYKALYESGKINEMPGFMKAFVNADTIILYQKMFEQRIPILVIGLISSTLCLYGALQMRKLKLQGYYLWLIGEILPYVVTFVLIGTAAFSGWALLSLLIPVVLIGLYTVKKKELIS